MAGDVLLSARLADAIPAGLALRVYHTSTRPTPASALFSAAPDQPEQETLCESHLLSIALPPQNDVKEDLLVFAIEVLVFTTDSLTTIFVSKADSTGYLHLLNLPKTQFSIVRAISSTFLEFLVDSRLNGPRIALSLFARSQNQYLFPGSVEYAGKHILDDRQLIKWWCRTLDPIVRHTDLQRSPTINTNETVGYVIVPGCDQAETRAFFPATARLDQLQYPKWKAAYPVELLAPRQDAPPRCLVPRLPDDPKARFLTDLDDGVSAKGQWKSVKTLDHFWEMMAYRQECSAGRLVGFIWVVFRQSSEPKFPTRPDEQIDSANSQSAPGVTPFTVTPINSQANGNATSVPLDSTTFDLGHSRLLGTSPPSSPISLPQREHRALEANQAELEVAGAVGKNAQPGSNTTPETTPAGPLIITSEQYQSLLDHLLQLDFSTQADAIQSSRSFLKQASEIAGRGWGETVTGQKNEAPPASSISVRTDDGVNILTGIRKKRKAPVVYESPQKDSLSEPHVATLAAGLIRKKPKT